MAIQGEVLYQEVDQDCYLINIVGIGKGFDYPTRTSQRINMFVKRNWTNEQKSWPFILVSTNFTPKQAKRKGW
jgi:hypothetical protein